MESIWPGIAPARASSKSARMECMHSAVKLFALSSVTMVALVASSIRVYTSARSCSTDALKADATLAAARSSCAGAFGAFDVTFARTASCLMSLITCAATEVTALTSCCACSRKDSSMFFKALSASAWNVATACLSSLLRPFRIPSRPSCCTCARTSFWRASIACSARVWKVETASWKSLLRSLRTLFKPSSTMRRTASAETPASFTGCEGRCTGIVLGGASCCEHRCS
mmetsp:Transcript_29037/g.66765  ORF Transcript_29037/g.66765 Transcript_29037/m.66765 type:complete len:229 (-) Transcript_29037:654-1340(-)